MNIRDTKKVFARTLDSLDKVANQPTARKSDEDLDEDATPHNTVRVDVRLAHVYALVECDEVRAEDIAKAIRQAIVGAVDAVLGSGLDGISIPQGPVVEKAERSKFLSREVLSFDCHSSGDFGSTGSNP